MADLYNFYDEAAKYYDEAYNDPFWCSECDELFFSSAQYFMHTFDHLYCAGCHKKFKSNAGMQKHMSESSKCLDWLRRSVGGSSSWHFDDDEKSEDDESSKGGPHDSTANAPLKKNAKSYAEHDIDPKTDKNSKCCRCKLQFESPVDLKEHFSKSRMHKVCNKCQLDLPSQIALNEHHRVSHPRSSALKCETTNTTCFFCSKSIDTQGSLEKHLQLEHFRCFPCEREFTSAKALNDHFSFSMRHNYCPSCDTDFLSAASLKEHSLSHLSKKLNSMNDHNNTPDSTSDDNEELDEFTDDDDSCLLCLEQFDTLLDKHWHEYDCHVSCFLCPKQFANRKAFNEHLLPYAGRFYCWECNDYSPFRDPRIDHRSLAAEEAEAFYSLVMSEAAVQKKVYVCDECDENETFKSVEDLEIHLSTNHFLCRKCEKDFRSEQALAQHTKASSRHGYCDICKRSNSLHQELNEKLRI